MKNRSMKTTARNMPGYLQGKHDSLIEQVNQRQDIGDEILRLQSERTMKEQNIIEYLLEENLTEFFNVNWTKLRQYSE